ncbi:MAG: CAP domain-containing protein [Clostridia bacterium]|nr:CAP domain-containing protein [Clostridia bacterium]
MNQKMKLWIRFLSLFLLAAFGVSLLAVPAQAEVKKLTYRTMVLGSDVVKVQPWEKENQIYEFLFNDQVVMRYRTMSQGLSAQERALTLWERAKSLGGTLKEGTVAVDCLQGSFVVTVADRLFVTVTEDDFKANNSTGEGLAQVWAENLRRAKRSMPDKVIQEKPVRENLTPRTPSETEKQQELEETGTEKTGTEETSSVPHESTVATAQELKMLGLINAERAKAGVKPLVLKPELVKIARIKSQEMIDENYFSHVSPTYGDPFTMLKNFGIKYGYAGENLAGNPTVENAHQSLMASSGHKKNILNPNYTHVGIGIVAGGPYGQMFTQLFISE